MSDLLKFFSHVTSEWLNEAKKEGNNSPAAFKLLLSAIVLALFLILAFGALTGRLVGNLAYVAEWSQIAGIIKPFYNSNLPPIFTAIAKCESGGSQYDEDGRVVRGRVNRHDVGLYQINEVIHERAIDTTGLNIYEEEGNAQFAAYLYQQSGLKPWSSSRNCWARYLD